MLKICLGVLEGVTTRQVETPCLGVRDTPSGAWKRKVSRRLLTEILEVIFTAHFMITSYLIVHLNGRIILEL